MAALTQEIKNNILTDFNKWKMFEESIIANTDAETTVIITLANFNLSALTTEHGVRIMKDILNVQNEVQGTATRMKRFVASCMLKYGERATYEYITICHNIMTKVYGVSKSTIAELNLINPCLWMCVLFTAI